MAIIRRGLSDFPAIRTTARKPAAINWFPGVGDLGSALSGAATAGAPPAGSVWAGSAGNPWAGGFLGGAGGRGGGMTNPYADLINNLLNQQRSDIKAESVADRASRDAAIRRLVISYGQTPDLANLGISGEASGVLGQVLDERTKALAAQNTAEGTSVSARIAHADEIARRDIPANLASMGRLHSGETGYQFGEQGLSNKQTVFDTLNELVSNIESSVGGYAANERQRQRTLAEAERQVALQAAQFAGGTDFGYGADYGAGYGYGGAPTTPAAPPPVDTAELQRRIYRQWAQEHGLVG